MKFYLIAGERSGDLHGSNLIRAIQKIAPDTRFRGFGGDYMKTAGMQLVVHYSEMAFMGFAEVLSNLGTIRRKLKQCKEDIISFQPDVIVLIDYAGFNLRIAKYAKEKGVRVFWYISPKVWAWNQKRAWRLKENVDRMFAILPFEKEFFKRFDWAVDYVGNPVLDAIKQHKPDAEFFSTYGIDDDSVIALLPGSRKQELKRVVPLMAEVAELNPDKKFAVAAVATLADELYEPLTKYANVQLVYDRAYDLLSCAKAAVVTSGTATLETALWKVPQVVVYRLRSIEYVILKQLVKVSYISLVNLIADKEVVKELIHDQANAITVNEELNRLLSDQDYRARVLSDYEEIYQTLDIGSASQNTAQLMISYLGK